MFSCTTIVTIFENQSELIDLLAGWLRNSFLPAPEHPGIDRTLTDPTENTYLPSN